nr:hypothetical protein [Phytohabitans rumicis]
MAALHVDDDRLGQPVRGFQGFLEVGVQTGATATTVRTMPNSAARLRRRETLV